jgi:hypothetical protein
MNNLPEDILDNMHDDPFEVIVPWKLRKTVTFDDIIFLCSDYFICRNIRLKFKGSSRYIKQLTCNNENTNILIKKINKCTQMDILFYIVANNLAYDLGSIITINKHGKTKEYIFDKEFIEEAIVAGKEVEADTQYFRHMYVFHQSYLSYNVMKFIENYLGITI